MIWNEVLKEWEQGNYFTYPSNIKGKFQWNTSVLKNNGESKYVEEFMVNKILPKSQDYTAFNEYIKKSNNKYVVSFPNPSGDTILIIPMPRANKNFATIKDFMENGSELQKRKFWEESARIIREEMKNNKYLWVSAHGLGVPYFHLRVCQNPKYYFSESLSKIN